MLRNVVEVAAFVGIFQIGGWRHNLITQGQHSHSCFQAARAAEKVPGHRLGGAHRELVGVIAEGTLDGDSLQPVAQIGVEVPWALI